MQTSVLQERGVKKVCLFVCFLLCSNMLKNRIVQKPKIVVEEMPNDDLELVINPGRDAWFELRDGNGFYLAGSNTPPAFAASLRVNLKSGRIIGWNAPSKDAVRKKFPSAFESE